MLEPVEDPLIKELARQSLTEKAELRKIQMNARKALSKKTSGQKGTFKFDDAHFIPKRPIRRPDGASLSEVYASKKQDLWGAIIKQQYLESEREKVEKREKKDQLNDAYGKALTKQLRDNEKLLAMDDGSSDKLMREVEELSNKNHNEQLRRTQAAKDRHKQFIEHALEDIETKRVKRLKDLDDEMFGSAMLIEKTKFLIQLDEEKKEAMKEKAKVENERLFAENLASIKKRQASKQADWDEVEKITRESNEAAVREDERRARELAHLVGRAADGPAHAVTRAITKQHEQNKQATEKHFLSITDSLSKQLKGSEDRDKDRREQLRGSGTISKSWDDMVHRLQAERNAERERGMEYGAAATRLDKEHWANEKVKKQKRLQAAAEYQKALDGQLSLLRNKSLTALKETMNQGERGMNMSLIRKYKIPQ
jgi:hypothetical protein